MIHTAFFATLSAFSFVGVLLNSVYFLVPQMMVGNVPHWHQPALSLFLIVQSLICLIALHSMWVGTHVSPWALLCGLISSALTTLFIFWIREFKRRYGRSRK